MKSALLFLPSTTSIRYVVIFDNIMSTFFFRASSKPIHHPRAKRFLTIGPTVTLLSLFDGLRRRYQSPTNRLALRAVYRTVFSFAVAQVILDEA